MTGKKGKKISKNLLPIKGIVIFAVLFTVVLGFRLLTVTTFKPKLGQDALYLDALNTERSKSMLEIYDERISFKCDFLGLPDNVLRANDHNRKPMVSYIDIPKGRLIYSGDDIQVKRQDLLLDKRGQIQIKDKKDPFLSFTRIFMSDHPSKTSNLGYGWSHNFNYQFFNIGEVYTIIDWRGEIYSFAYDYKDERFQQISGLATELVRKGEDDFIWTTPDKSQLSFNHNRRFSQYSLNQIKTLGGRVLDFKYDQEIGKFVSIRDTATDLSLEFRYGANGLISQVTFSDNTIVNYKYDETGNLLSSNNLSTGYLEEYDYKSLNNIHSITNIKMHDRKLSFVYDTLGRIEAVIHGEGKTSRFIYDDILGIVGVTDVEGNNYKYICEGKAILRIVDPIKNEQHFFYSNNRQILKAVFADGSYMIKKYNDTGNIMESEIAPGNVNYFDYNLKSGKLAKFINPLGRMVKFEFNESGLPIKRVGLKGENFLMEYDSFGRITGITDPSNVKYTFNYDNWGNVQKIFSSGGRETFYEYDELGRLKTHVNREGIKKEIRYEDKDRTKKIIYSDGSVCLDKFNNFGEIIKRVFNKQITKYNYDAAGNLTEVIFANGQKIKKSYDNIGNVVYEKNIYGVENEYVYDGLSRLIEEKNVKTNALTKFEYSKEQGSGQKLFSPQFTKKTFPDSEVLTNKYDSLGQIIEIIEPTGKKKEISYDKTGNITKIKKNELFETIYAYDQAENLESVFKPGNQIFLYDYNWRHQIIGAVDPEAHPYTYRYDDNGNLQSVYNAEKQTFSFFYSPSGNLTAFEFPSKLVYEYGYDDLNRLVTIAKGPEDFTEVSYDLDGSISSIAHSSGIFESRSYNNLRLLTAKKFSDDTLYNYSYDNYGRIKTINGDGFNKTFEYDDEARVSRMTINQLSFTFSYTKGGKISRIIYPDRYEIAYEYDEKGLIKEIKDSSGDKILFKYDARGNKQSIHYSNRVKETFGYDDLGLVSRIKISNWKDEKILDAYMNYNYLNQFSDLKVSQLQRDEEEVRYQYDSLMRITREVTDEKQNEYHYDPNGNLIEESSQNSKDKRSFAKSQDNMLTRIEDSLFSGGGYVPLLGVMPKRPPEYVNVNESVCQIDRKKNMFYLDKFKLHPGENILKINAIDRIGYKESLKMKVFLDEEATATFSYDPIGNIQCISKKGTIKAFEWNHQNRIENVINERREVTKYGYYDDGMLAFTTDDYGDRTQFIYGPNGKLLAEQQGKGGLSAKYVYAPDGSILFKLERGEKKYFYHLLPDRSVKVMTDRFGNLAKQYSYDGFGKVTGEVGRIRNNFLYKGMFFDEYSDLYFHKGRYYSAEYRAYLGGDLRDVGFAANHLSPVSNLFGIDVLLMHLNKKTDPLPTLQKKIDVFYGY